MPELTAPGMACFRLVGSRQASHLRSNGAAPESRMAVGPKQRMSASTLPWGPIPVRNENCHLFVPCVIVGPPDVRHGSWP